MNRRKVRKHLKNKNLRQIIKNMLYYKKNINTHKKS